jgi:hypothetical protein
MTDKEKQDRRLLLYFIGSGTWFKNEGVFWEQVLESP